MGQRPLDGPPGRGEGPPLSLLHSEGGRCLLWKMGPQVKAGRKKGASRGSSCGFGVSQRWGNLACRPLDAVRWGVLPSRVCLLDNKHAFNSSQVSGVWPSGTDVYSAEWDPLLETESTLGT